MNIQQPPANDGPHRHRAFVRENPKRRSGGLSFLLAASAVLHGVAAIAQEPVNAIESATQPSPGLFIFKQQFQYHRFELERGPAGRRGVIDEFVLTNALNVGIWPDVSLSMRVPTLHRERDMDGFGYGRSERDTGVGDATLLAKWRVYRNDTSAIDTQRVAVFGGADIRTGDGPFTGDAYNPLVGAAYTQIAGRHGFNASMQWEFTTDGNREPIAAGESTADLLTYDLAYLFRLSPARYTAETHGALYVVGELNGLYETNGDNELFLSPGLMYEARTWTLELSVQVPVWQRIEDRAEMRVALMAGLRVFW